MPYFDRFDICEAYYLIEMDYHIGGILWERESNARRHMSTIFQLTRMGFRPSPILSIDSLTKNGRAIYDDLIEQYNLVNAL